MAVEGTFLRSYGSISGCKVRTVIYGCNDGSSNEGVVGGHTFFFGKGHFGGRTFFLRQHTDFRRTLGTCFFVGWSLVNNVGFIFLLYFGFKKSLNGLAAWG